MSIFVERFWPAPPTHERRDIRVADLLLVAGPSGAGKSSFVRVLKSRELRPEIEAALPGNAADWQRANAHALGKAIGNFDGGRLILEYEITEANRRGGSYRDDDALALLRCADRATIVTISVEGPRIVRHLGNRAVSRGHRKSAMKLLWWRTARRALKKLRARLEGDAAPYKSELFAAPGWLDRCYRQWDDFLRVEAAAHRWTVLNVVPAGGGGPALDFAIAGPAGPTRDAYRNTPAE